MSLGYILYIASLENGCFYVYHLDEKMAQKLQLVLNLMQCIKHAAFKSFVGNDQYCIVGVSAYLTFP